MNRTVSAILPTIFLLVSLFSFNACTAPGAGHLPNITPARMSITDSLTYTKDLERAKKWEQLNTLLRAEYGAIQLMDVNIRGGIYLSEAEKETIREVFQQYGSKDPQGDFFRMRQIDPVRKEYDVEGRVYLLDDLAHLHTYCLVDFRKAQEYNEQAKAVLSRIQSSGIGDIPLSDYYNSRRFLYDTFFYRPAEKMPQGHRLFPGRIDLVTPFPDQYISLTRNLDYERVGERIRARESFLREKLGEGDGAALPVSPGGQRIDRRALFRQTQDFLEKWDRDDVFHREFQLTSMAFSLFRSTGDASWLDDVIRHGEDTLKQSAEVTLEAQNAVNLSRYWLGMAYLKRGDTTAGVDHLEGFLAGIDQLETLAGKQYLSRQAVLDKVNVEQIEAARRDAAWQTAFAVVLFAAGAYTSVSGPATGPQSAASQQVAQSLAQMSSSVYQGARDQLLQAEQSAQMRVELAKYITPYSLKVNRYLDKYEMVDFFLGLGRAYEQAGRPDKALTQYEEAVRIIERQRSTILSERQRISFSGARQELYERIVDVLVSLGQPERALEYVERAKSRALVDILGSTRLKMKTREQTDRYDRLLSTRAEVDTLLSEKGVSADQIGLLSNKVKRGIILKEKEKAGAEGSQEIELQSLASVETLSAAEMMEMAGSDRALLAYFLGKAKLHIFLVQDHAVRVVSRPVDERQLAAKVAEWRDLIGRRTAARALEAYFYDLLVSHVSGDISKRQIVVIPHRILHYLPFQAFHDGKGYLVERYAISYTPSVTSLRLVEQKPVAKNGRALVIGNPSLDLKFAEEEAVQISNLRPGSMLLTKEQATEDYVKEHGGDFEYLHFATHGEYNEANPLSSGIVFRYAGNQKSILTAAELFAIQWRASLVTLSACETGLSRQKTGDELIGLQRALMFAGTKSIVSTLWSVDDQATAFLMPSFYKNLAAMPKNKALQQAQIETMKRFPNPYYWAAFNLTGATQE